MGIRYFLVFAGLLLLLSSCEKKTVEVIDGLEAEIIGSWSRTDIIPSGRTEADFRYFDMVFTYTFKSDATYSNTIDFYGFEDENPEEIIGQSKTEGIYEIKGDSIFMSTRQITSWEKGFKLEPETVTFENELTFGSRFEIIDGTLTLYYISYPADAPLLTQITYQKVE